MQGSSYSMLPVLAKSHEDYMMIAKRPNHHLPSAEMSKQNSVRGARPPSAQQKQQIRNANQLQLRFVT